MSTQSYIHITSPIRRLVDLLNQMILFRQFNGHSMSQDSCAFFKKWTDQIEYINTAMRSIRKIQTDCEVLNRCFTTPDIMEKDHKGVLFDKIMKNDGTIHYMVYLEKLKMLSRITTHIELTNHSYHNFRIFLFEDEDKSKKKIRLQIA
jgi:exoribonuclease R